MKALAAKLTAGGIVAASIAGISLLVLSGDDDPNRRFSGGASDGSASAIFLQSPSLAYMPSPQFSGSAYDGSASVYLLQSVAGGDLPSPRFSGGIFDGSDTHVFLQSNDTIYQSSARYTGGAFDGHAMTALATSGNSVQQGAPRFYGGNGDGYATKSLSSNGIPSEETVRFSGGAFDGADTQAFVQSSDASYQPSARYAGGTFDGHAVAVLASTVDTEAQEEARFYGGSYDGSAVAATLSDIEVSSEESLRFSGGAFDGAASIVFSGNITAPNSSPRFSGGSYDGHASIIAEGSSIDLDNDGLPDEWERLWFDNLAAMSSTSDNDSDGASSYDEFIAGTDPTNPASYFHAGITATQTTIPPSFIIEWTAVSGRVYNVLWTPSLMQDFQPLEIGIQYPQGSYTDMVHTVESSGFYRVVVMLATYDADGDGLPNDWETQYAVTDAYAHGDSDGFNNLEEFIAGTDPTNSASFFAAASSMAEVNGTNCFVVEWISIPDRYYSIQWSTNLLSGFEAIETHIEHPQNSYTDIIHHAEAKGFYKVDVRIK